MLLLYPLRFWSARISCLFTFHYASTLSISARVLQGHTLIYIPLCFYFIGDAGVVCKVYDFIYIPLCFYFIVSVKHMDELSFLFTFHYASTLSVHLLQKSLRGNLFTFHYASTLSIQKWRRSIKCINLHSTMLLLYLTEDEDVTIPAKFTFHYASTLSDKTHRHYRADYWFTFHYASTLSEAGRSKTGHNL